MTTLAITVLGHDRPGIIAQTADALAASGMNLEDSSMTLLRGHFAMTLICTGDADAASVQQAMTPLLDDRLSVSVREVAGETQAVPAGTTYLLTVHGADRLGIVARLTTVVAEAGGNITDLTTRLSGELYVLAAEVDFGADVDLETTREELSRAAVELGVDATLRALERDEL